MAKQKEDWELTDKEFRNKERNVGVENERNNWGILIGNSKTYWAVFTSKSRAEAAAKTINAKGKAKARVQETGAAPYEPKKKVVKEAKEAEYVLTYSKGKELFEEPVLASALLRYGQKAISAGEYFLKDMDPNAKFVSIHLKEAAPSNVDKLLEKLESDQLDEGLMSELGAQLANAIMNRLPEKWKKRIAEDLFKHFGHEMSTLTIAEVADFVKHNQPYINKLVAQYEKAR